MRGRVVLILLTSLSFASSVRADLGAWSSPAGPSGGGVDAAAVALDAWQGISFDQSLDAVGLLHDVVLLPTQGTNAQGERAVVQLPPAPGSAALFLSAMASLGALQLVRSSKDIRFSALPEWYHAGGPVQVGHVTPFDLDFSSMVLCIVEPPGIFGQAQRFRGWRDQRTHFCDQQFLTPADSRGPPTHAG